jgi:hypothetical protein
MEEMTVWAIPCLRFAGSPVNDSERYDRLLPYHG